MNVIIVGSGPSVAEIDPGDILNANAHVIAVNGAIEWLNSADSWFTLDPSADNLKRMNNPIHSVNYYAAVDQRSWNKIPKHVTKLQRLSNPPIRIKTNFNSPEYWFKRWGCKKGLAENRTCINTGNSAYGALGLAYHWRPSKILLLGVDGDKKSRVTGDGPCKFSLTHLPVLFKHAKQQLDKNHIRLINASPSSLITCFPRVSPKRGIQWISK